MKNNNNNYRKKINKNSILIDKSIPSKKLKIVLKTGIVLLILLIIRLFWIQFIDGAWLKEKAFRQQTASKIISPDRGSILDVNGKYLAKSEKVDTISINPTKISKEKKTIVATGLSQIFELDYEETLTKVNSTSSFETIIKKVQNDKVQQLQEWMSENKINVGINIDEDTKRYYPYNDLASQVVGFLRYRARMGWYRIII